MNHRPANLDRLRGHAALTVGAGPLRAFRFVDFGPVAAPGMRDRWFHWVTRPGQPAAVRFGGLSGDLVGGSVLTAHPQGRGAGKEPCRPHPPLPGT